MIRIIIHLFLFSKFYTDNLLKRWFRFKLWTKNTEHRYNTVGIIWPWAWWWGNCRVIYNCYRLIADRQRIPIIIYIWKPSVVIPTLSSLVTPLVGVAPTCVVTSDAKVGIMKAQFFSAKYQFDWSKITLGIKPHVEFCTSINCNFSTSLRDMISNNQ